VSTNRKARPATDPELFYIQDTRSVVGNSALWWREQGKGYTSNLDEAWKVPGNWSWRSTDILRPVAEMDALAERHVDVQKLNVEDALTAARAVKR
jgi:hypothetical protein